LLETVPAYSSLAVYFDPFSIDREEVTVETAFDTVCRKIDAALGLLSENERHSGRQIEIPAVFGGDAGPDLAFVAEHNGITEAETIEIFVSQEYRVFFLGFLPGFPYMGELDPRIRAPRKKSPRTSVPAGSIGIAGSQTGIYPLDSPGGWQIVGRTDVMIFNPERPEPPFLLPGDIVKFKFVRN
jgi:inhibitor of KinA